MNFVDIMLLVPILWGAWKGFKKGLIIELFTLLALLVGIYAAINFSDFTAEKISGNFTMEDKYLPVVAFTITFLVVGALIYFAGKMIEKMVQIVNLSTVNKLLGLFLGALKMVYTLSVLIILVETYDERGAFIPTDIKKESFMYTPTKNIALYTIPAVEESRIWLKNNMQNSDSNTHFSINDLIELKNKADSLGIDFDSIQRIEKEWNEMDN
ncbi:MAG: CvpA family protein [Lishizhenia sp.]